MVDWVNMIGLGFELGHGLVLFVSYTVLVALNQFLEYLVSASYPLTSRDGW